MVVALVHYIGRGRCQEFGGGGGGGGMCRIIIIMTWYELSLYYAGSCEYPSSGGQATGRTHLCPQGHHDAHEVANSLLLISCHSATLYQLRNCIIAIICCILCVCVFLFCAVMHCVNFLFGRLSVEFSSCFNYCIAIINAPINNKLNS